MQESHRHHFVPKLLLRPWLVEEPKGQFLLSGYWWNPHTNSLTRKRRGLDSFCCQLDLLTLSVHHLGRDVLERIFFGEIDVKGAEARDALQEGGSVRLSWEQRCDFVRLLLSLEARRPVNIAMLRQDGAAEFRRGLDEDPEIRKAFEAHGIDESPSTFAERTLGWCLEDRAALIVQRLVDNRKVGERLAQAHWAIKRLGPYDGTLVLADRPLIRTHAYNDPSTVWAMPLSPTTGFIAANSSVTLARLMKLTGQKFAKKMNVSSALQAERFVFAIDRFPESWIAKYLRPAG